MPRGTVTDAPAQTDGLEVYRHGPLAGFLAERLVFDLAVVPHDLFTASPHSVLFAARLLQDIADYRGALQRWFAGTDVGSYLVVTVPHAFLDERQDAAPSRRRASQRRLYSPRALIEEVEEALIPNTYRVRWLGDLDGGYDYSSEERVGQADVAVVLERIVAPNWDLTEHELARPAPQDLFESDHTRIEAPVRVSVFKILALKLDHIGDFVMGIDALGRLRTTFPAAEITLVVGSWNESMARELNVADHIIVFDAYPRNSGEERPDIGGRTALFDALVSDRYDLAVDFRTNSDSRFLLRNVNASIKAGIGLKAHFPFLDIFLPIDPHIDHYDVAWTEEFGPDRFFVHDYCSRSRFSIACIGDRVSQDGHAIVWGPYRHLPLGQYVFEPFIEMDGGPGLLACDVGLNTQRVAYQIHPQAGTIRLAFDNTDDEAQVEFRLFPVANEPVPNFRFYGGRLSKRGAASSLHQSEYLILLVELIALRVTQTGLFRRADA